MTQVSTEVIEGVRAYLAREARELSPSTVAEALRGQGAPVGDATVLSVHDALRTDVLGAGPLEPLLAIPGVTDVLVNGAEQVWIDRGKGLERSGVRFPDEAAVRRLAVRLASVGGRRLDDASPYVDVRMPDGTRFHAVLAPLARPGTVISLRVPRAGGFTFDELVTAGALPEEGVELIRAIMRRRLAFLISGGTGTGKTTLLNAMLTLADESERLVIVEDASELRPDRPHVVAMESRPANIEGAGEIPMRTLVRQALRMRPDRVVVGEVRGNEVVDLLAALNTGHEGGCGTVHANSAADVPARLEGLAMAAGLNRDAAHAQMGAALDVVIHLTRSSEGTRHVREIGVLEMDRGVCSVSTAVKLGGRLELGPAIDVLEQLLRR